MKTITIDWLTFTFKEFDNDAKQFLADFTYVDTAVSATPVHGYTAARRDQNGVLFMWNSDRPEMGLHVIFAGSALRNLQQEGSVEPREILIGAKELGGRCTRLDLAKDAAKEGVSLTKIWHEIEHGDRSGQARKFSQMNGLKGGHTIYVGSRTSERFMRLYDKAAEQHMEGEDWIRFEIELKGMTARSAAKLIVDGGDMQDVFDALALAALKLPECDDYNKFFTEDRMPVGFPKIEKQTDREAWILRQVLPAVREHLNAVKDSPACIALYALLENWNSNHE